MVTFFLLPSGFIRSSGSFVPFLWDMRASFFLERRKQKAEGKIILIFLGNKNYRFGVLKKGMVDVTLVFWQQKLQK